MFNTTDFCPLVFSIALVSSATFAQTVPIYPCGCHNIHIPTHFVESSAITNAAQCEQHCTTRAREMIRTYGTY